MIITLRETTSTNDYAKKLATYDVEPFTTVVAHRQTAGKGRLGRSFHSPEDEGIYMSIILYPHGSGANQLHYAGGSYGSEKCPGGSGREKTTY